MSSSTNNDVIALFASHFPQTSTLPSSPAYASLASAHWASNVVSSPGCIFTPSTAQEVSDALKFITQHEIPFQVRGGGHNTNRGWASVGSDGVLICSEGLRTLELCGDGTKKVLNVGAGLHFREVYEFLEREGSGLTIAGGNQALPGVSGFYLGGGVGPYWNRYGYSANTIRCFEVVLASGDIVVATPTSHPDHRWADDLFWALKSGLSNFGILTRIELMTFPIATLQAGLYILPPPGYTATFDAFDVFLKEHGNSQYATASLISPTKGVVMLSLFYDGPHADAEVQAPEFAPFKDLPKVKSTFGKTSWVAIAKGSEAIMPNGLRRYWSTITIHQDVSLLSRIFDAFHDSAKAHLSSVEAGTYQILSLPQGAASARKNDFGPFALRDSDPDTFTILMLPTWKNASDDDAVRTWLEATTEELGRVAEAKGQLHNFIYVNDANEKQDAFGSLERETLERMRDISRKYDPERIFQRLMKGGPKLGV